MEYMCEVGLSTFQLSLYQERLDGTTYDQLIAAHEKFHTTGI
jgi:hypothetical protein